MIEFNYRDEIVSSPTVIVSGRVTTGTRGVIQFKNNENSVFPLQSFEVNNSHFKALVHVSPNQANNFNVTFWNNARLDQGGYPQDLHTESDRGGLTLHCNPLVNNKPVHLCVVLGKDSKGLYDMPKYKTDRGEVANLDSAVQRLRVAARMMQGFTQDEFHRLGLSNRSFQFIEETTKSWKTFGFEGKGSREHTEVKVHVLRSPKTVAELRNPDYAQQNPNAKDNGFLFGHAMDLVSKSDFYKPYKAKHTPIQCAAMYLDSHWDGQLISTHAALGGGSGEIKMAIFGSHGLHAYPLHFAQVSACLVDETRLSLSEVANDVNQCGTSWECLNICMGAFMHEIGHSFGSPHQVDGVMLRDYMWWNRSFATREMRCLRDGSPGRLIGSDGNYPKVCHWNILDIMRYFYHGSFAIPADDSDRSFTKVSTTLMNPRGSEPIPSLYITSPGKVVVKSSVGIYMVEFVGDDLARHHMTFYPVSYGGPGLQYEIPLDFDDCLREVKRKWKGSAEDFHVRVLSVSGDLWMENFKSRCYPAKDSEIQNDFNLGRGVIKGSKSELLGSKTGDMKFIGFDPSRVYQVRVYHGGALDGMTFYFHAADKKEADNTISSPKASKRHLLGKLIRNSAHGDRGPNGNGAGSSGAGEVTIGNKTRDYTDFHVPVGEKIRKFSFRNGAWIDAVKIETDRGTSSAMLGNANGGHLSVLEPPSGNHSVVGLYGYTGQWLDGIGIIYAQI